MKTQKQLIGIVIFLISGITQAQSVKLFSPDDDLSNSLINQIYQDRNGIIWIATEDGLNRYDGSKFTILKHDDSNPNSPLHNYVRYFLEDDQGNFYVSYLNGLQLYDDASHTFKEIPIILQSGIKFSAHVVVMLQRRNGDILLSTAGHGVCKLMKNAENKLYAAQLPAEGYGPSVGVMFEDAAENLWIVSDSKGLFRLSPNNEIKTYFPANSIQISSICQDKEGNIYAGSFGNGVFRLDSATDSFIPVPYPAHPHLPVKTLFVDGSNRLLIGTEGYGMKAYHAGAPHLVDEDFNVITFDFSKSKVHSILEDLSGNIWLGIFQKGIMCLPPLAGNFGYIGYNSIKHNLIGSNCVMSLYTDRQGMLWVGTDSDGLYAIDDKISKSKHYSNSMQGVSVPSTIMCIFEDSEQQLWLGSYLQGLAKLNRKTGKCEYVKGILDQNQFPVTRVYSLLEDDDKNLWIATMGGGLFYMNLRNNKITRYPDDVNYINAWINCLLKSRDNKLYIGTYDGISIIDLNTKQVINNYYGILFERETIYALYEDAEGLIWVGTSQGLSSYHPKTNITVKYTTNDGLPSHVVSAIRGDSNGKLWLSTNRGISHFTPNRRTFTNYFLSDGLQGNEFSKQAVCTNSRGEIFFGGLNGITFFHPEKVTVPEKTLQIRLTDFYIHDKPVRKGMKSGHTEIIDQAVMHANTFRLAHNDNSFTIEFATTEFHAPERISYMYSMNNEGWIQLRPGTNRISFNNLAPGNYHFKVNAQDYNALSDIKEIDVLISPPWYASFWAKCLYWLIGLSLIALVILVILQRYRAGQRLLEHLHAQEINEAKLQFFINISHEIRTPMSLVISPLKKLMATDKDQERQKAYSTMNRSINHILNLINQLLDIRKIDKGLMNLKFQQVDIIAFLNDIHLFFEEQATMKNIRFRLESDVEQLNAWVDVRHFDKVIINILSNAFKFTPEHGEVTVSVKDVSGFYEIIISDSGIGINENEIAHIFDRFYQGKNSTTKAYEGTGIGLHLARSIVKLHHGTIEAGNNATGTGACFIIRLPQGNKHLRAEDIVQEHSYAFKNRDLEIPVLIESNEDEVKIRSKSKRYVLVVDDDKEIREYICRELSPDYHTIECANGKEALNAIHKRTPDLVISDVVMPEMDGITLCRKLKQNININHIPVILLTAKSKEEDNLEGLDIGADAYLVKPFNIEFLKKTAQNIIKNREMLRNSFSGSQQQKDKISKITMMSADDKLMERFMKVINKNIANPELNVEMIAKEVGISRVHLHRKLKELTNQSTRDLIRNIRLEQAAELLRNKRLTIAEVATATGFTNQTYFSTAFKEAYGVSPMMYMERSLEEGVKTTKII